ncbi:hypothetical protein HK104_006515, partial [Borealophlyctis nickersoniae]
IERVCLFERGSLPADIPLSERYEVEDSGDVEVGSISASRALSEVWTLANQNLPAFSAFGTLPVVLDDARLEAGKVLVGSVLVRNLAFEKTVSVRYTSDGWATHDDVEGRFASVVSGPTEGFSGVDRFVFELDLNEDLDLGEATEATIQFAINYVVGGDSYWDNNGGQNYQFAIRRPNRQPTRPVPLKSLTQPVVVHRQFNEGWDKPPVRPRLNRCTSFPPSSPSSTPPPASFSPSSSSSVIPVSLPMTPTQRRQSRAAIVVSKQTFLSEAPLDRFAASAEPPRVSPNTATTTVTLSSSSAPTSGIEIPFSGQAYHTTSHPIYATTGGGNAAGGAGASRLYASSDSFESLLACSPPSTFHAACRA